MNVLVTGATGFIGNNLANTLLQQGHNVTCLARNQDKAKPLVTAGCLVAEEDLLAPRHLDRFLRECDVVFHVAGVVAGTHREEYFSGNLITTRNLLQAINQYSPPHQKVVYISSQAAAGPSTRPDFSESCPEAHPVSAYGESKLAAETEMLAMADIRPVVILRPSIVYGPGDRALLPLFRSAQWGILPRPGLRDMPVNFIYVKDLVRAIILAAEKVEANNRIFFINDGIAYSWSTWNTTLAESLGRKVISIPIAKSLLHAGCRLGAILATLSGKAQYLNSDKWNEIRQNGWLCSSSLFREELGFVPSWTLTDGITETAAWYRKKGWLRK